MTETITQSAEGIILGSFLQNNSTFRDIPEYLFLNPIYKKIYQTIREKAYRKQPFDILTIHNELPEIEVQRIAELTNNTYGTIDSHLEVMKDSYRRYRLLSVKSLSSDSTLKPQDAMDQISHILSEMIFLSGDSYHPGKDYLQEEVRRIEQRYKLKDQPGYHYSGIPGFFSPLDDLTDGFQNQELAIIHGLPSTGKTALCLDMFRRQSKQNITSGFFSQEMYGAALMQRMIAQESQINSVKLKKGLLSKSDFAKLGEAAGRIYQLPIIIDDKPNQLITDIVRKAHAMKREHEIQILYVDHLGLIRHPDNRMNKTEKIGEYTKELKKLARDLNIPVVLISQENKDGQIYYSAEANQDADLQIRLTNNDDKDSGVPLINVEIKKNRNGPTGVVKLRFMKSIQLFSDDLGDTL